MSALLVLNLATMQCWRSLPATAQQLASWQAQQSALWHQSLRCMQAAAKAAQSKQPPTHAVLLLPAAQNWPQRKIA
jgi:hypothetical protein